VEDICRAFMAALEAPREKIHNEAFNVGRSTDNLQIREVAELVRAAVPGSELSFAEGAGPDLRNYRVDFAKLTDTFPALNLAWAVPQGVQELVAAYTAHGLNYTDFGSSRFVRLRRIKELIEAGQLDQLLRRPAEAPALGPAPA
jgi:nucleoside-diphosphate-sugar epimerase